MKPTSKYLRMAGLLAVMLAVSAGSLGAQTDTKRRTRKHRMFAAQTGPDQATLVWDEVPGATEYRIYLPDPSSPAPPAPATRPLATFSASGRQATIAGIRQLSNGAYLVAMKGQQVLLQEQFAAVTRAPLAPPAPPAAVSARETGETEVTVSWPAVPGATAYRLGRAVGGGGLQTLCGVCPPEAVFVDTTATPGLEHTYTVQAIFPLGLSDRTRSDPITVGAAQLAAAGGISSKPMASGTPVGGTEADNTNAGAATGTPTGGSVGTGTPTGSIPATGQPAGTTSTYTPPGQPAGTTPTYTPPGTSAGATPTYTPPGQPASTLPATSTPVTATPASQPGTADFFTAVVGRLQDRLTYLLGSVASASTTVHAATPISASTDQVASAVSSIKGNLSNLLGNISSQLASGGTITHAATPVTTGTTTSSTTNNPLFSQAFAIRDQLASLFQAVGVGTLAAGGAITTSPFGTLADAIRADLTSMFGGLGLDPMAGLGTTVHTATPITTTPATSTPATATPAPASCRVDYQRADNMWAAFGRADGQLGTESIALPPGQSRVFVTDWKYEKQRNDGTNFYGSHLRIASNPTARPVRLQLRTTTLTGLLIFARTGSDTFWIRLDPNASKQFQADLMEVYCEQ